MSNYSFDEPQVEEFDVVPERKPTTRSALPSLYDQVRAELTKPIDVAPTITLKIPARDLSIKFSTDLPLIKLDRWRNASRKHPKNPNSTEIDLLQFNQYIIAGQAICLVLNGEDAVDDNGEYLNFKHADVQASLNSLDHQGAIKTLFGRDADILKIGQDILEEAGYAGSDEFANEDDDSDPLV